MLKEDLYKTLVLQIKELLNGESDLIANLSNISSAIHYTFNFHWTGFYLVKANNLVLGPFQGPVACSRIGFGKGVCGKSWEQKTTLLVNDVHQFEGHIACSPLSQSEIVIPLLDNKAEVFAVLDIDSEHINHFDEVDSIYLNQITKLIKQENT